ncbi:CDP-3,6-dideoxy-D-glycero-L-glycero-4-hexulose-4-reductase [Scytonema hofmannii PCC 7110]|uniref:CDP-3, 6-dideoxy-D-glycero-L-glycero-4-hexulose-4-reductase n=1 Tax=Scytonema hofmannii PCC 7110 TaxID=128403 RepID=A0A139XG22_9CYAN|nr:MinD/ParA family protein [Scytonema hofmannii]KYC43619.1 CDP-3,6-dideoxy-D-glycero-L-glycero-4-hexulose-4-reductase [Scytonema hofmannii PCC 7110]
MSKIIAVHSFRGGTGKSNLTANLAVALALQDQRVAIIDTDLQSPGIHALFNINETATGNTLNDYLWNHCSIADTAYDVSSYLEIAGKGKVFLIPSSINAEEIARIVCEGYNVSILKSGFKQLIEELQLDYLFIDTHPGLSRETLLSIALSDLLMVILRPDRQDFQGTAVTVNIARQLQVQMMMIVNKVPSRMNFSELQQKVEKTYNVPIAGILPLTEDVAQLGSSGIFCLEYPDHPFSQMLLQVVEKALWEAVTNDQ